jgi:hypothetical protein
MFPCGLGREGATPTVSPESRYLKQYCRPRRARHLPQSYAVICSHLQGIAPAGMTAVVGPLPSGMVGTRLPPRIDDIYGPFRSEVENGQTAPLQTLPF